MAPVLALLDDVPGVAESRVDWTGRRFLLRLDPDAQVATVVAQADEALGGDSRRLDSREASEAASAYLRGETHLRGERWMRAGETLDLSREEAHVLAERYSEEAAHDAGLDPRQMEQLVSVLESEIAAAFERIHAEGKGLPPQLNAVFRLVMERTLERSRAFLRPAQLRSIEDSFAERTGG